jgi:hypothetical protein
MRPQQILYKIRQLEQLPSKVSEYGIETKLFKNRFTTVDNHEVEKFKITRKSPDSAKIMAPRWGHNKVMILNKKF